MGKWIDRAVLTALAAAALYLLFLFAFDSIIPASCMAFFCCALVIHARRGKPGRMTKHQAQGILERWAYGPDDESRQQIEKLVGISDSQTKLVYLPKHPTAALSMSDVFSAWKSNRDADRLILATPCYAEGRARTFTRTLQNPSAELLDASRLIPMIRRSNLTASGALNRKGLLTRLRTVFCELPHRRPWYKSLAGGSVLMLVYLVSGNAAYLILSTAMLFLAGVSIRVRS